MIKIINLFDSILSPAQAAWEYESITVPTNHKSKINLELSRVHEIKTRSALKAIELHGDHQWASVDSIVAL